MCKSVFEREFSVLVRCFSLSFLLILAVLCPSLASAQTPAEVHLWSAGDLASQAADLLKNAGETGGSAGKTLDTQPQNLTMLTTRNSSGGAEKHQFWSDYLIVLDGEGQELTGGSIIAPKTQENGEIRGQRLEGAASHTLHKGDILFIPAGTPHQALEAPGQHITIFVIKVAKPAPTA